MTSLVIGATGIVGGYIVDRLLQAGERPIALSRSTRSSATDVEWLRGNRARCDQIAASYDTLLHGPRGSARRRATIFF